jgi:CheY-like chemotaxis protein
VLYIEQDPDHALKASDHFAVHADHIYLHSVSTKEEALYKLTQPGSHGPYDVLLLDFELPGLKAVETLRNFGLHQIRIYLWCLFVVRTAKSLRGSG